MKSKNNEVQKNADYKIECNSIITAKGLKDIGITKNSKEFDKRVKLLKAYAKEIGLIVWTDEPIDVPLGDEVFDEDDIARD